MFGCLACPVELLCVARLLAQALLGRTLRCERSLEPCLLCVLQVCQLLLVVADLLRLCELAPPQPFEFELGLPPPCLRCTKLGLRGSVQLALRPHLLCEGRDSTAPLFELQLQLLHLLL